MEMEGRQSSGTVGQALPPVLVVTTEDWNPSLLPKQEEWLGPCCPKTVCPPFSPSGSICKLHTSILHEKWGKNSVYYHLVSHQTGDRI